MIVEHFNIKVVREGEKYGFGQAHTGGVPLVEFYDSRHVKSNPLGQIVGRYYLSTLLASVGGLNLDGGVPSWRISERGMEDVRGYLKALT